METFEEGEIAHQNAKDAWVLKRLKFLVDGRMRELNTQRAKSILDLIKTIEDDLEMQIQAI